MQPDENGHRRTATHISDTAPELLMTTNGSHNHAVSSEVAVADKPDEHTRVGQIPISVVVPTRNEVGNIDPLLRSLIEVLPPDAEVIFVDDSDDDTPEAIRSQPTTSPLHIRLIHRSPGQRDGGLGGAVVAGLNAAQAPWVCVMDGDLQHPPEVIPRMLLRAGHDDVDLVVASRYRSDGDAHGLKGIRTAISRASTTLARLAFGRNLHGVSDPMSGFFLVRKSALRLDALQPEGFKILLEILVRTPRLRVSEVGFQFGERHSGESKATLQEGMRYLSHLAGLRFGANWVRFTEFVAVGATGLVVNLLVLLAATELLSFHYMLSVVLATWGSTLWNFGFTDIWVFRGRQTSNGRWQRLAMFAFINNAALLFRAPMIYVLTAGLAIHYLASNIISLAVFAICRYALSDMWIWKHARTRKLTYHYDIHGVVTVTSDVWLPELESFLTPDLPDQPTVRVTMGSWRRGRPATRVVADPSGQRFSYDEGLGSLGFWIDVSMGETIDIVASPLLRRSPHVLYTNVVEPILRWTFVRKGYGLVHGACIAFGRDAYLVTARTDTGKTTTILRLLDRQRRATDTGGFLSDDLTLVSPSGRVLTYPKPLTISRHTVAAVNTPLLSRRQRVGLFIQSRLHSRGGRRFALNMAQTRLPVATINTIVQWLVPPPKYHVQQLVPRVRHLAGARLAGMFVIERGADGDTLLEPSEALNVLMTNSDDAYGFPPYPLIRGYLHGSNGHDLQEAERLIVAQALNGVPTRLLRSSAMDWSLRIPALIVGSDMPVPRRAPDATMIAAGLSVAS